MSNHYQSVFDNTSQCLTILRSTYQYSPMLHCFQVFAVRLTAALCQQYRIHKTFGVAKLCINTLITLMGGNDSAQCDCLNCFRDFDVTELGLPTWSLISSTTENEDIHKPMELPYSLKLRTHVPMLKETSMRPLSDLDTAQIQFIAYRRALLTSRNLPPPLLPELPSKMDFYKYKNQNTTVTAS